MKETNQNKLTRKLKRESYFVADFETTTDFGRPWSISLVNVLNDYEDLEDVKNACLNLNYHEKNSKRKKSTINVFTNIDDFMDYLSSLPFSPTVFFHNLKWDGLNIMNFLERAGYRFNPDSKNLQPNQYYSLISERGDFFTLEVCVKKVKKGKDKDGKDKFVNRTIKFRDSLKLLPFKVSQLSKNFCPKIPKLDTTEFGLKTEDDVLNNYTPTANECLYNVVDSVIVAKALKYLLFFQPEDDIYINFDKISLSSVSLETYKFFLSHEKLGSEHARNFKLREEHFRKIYPILLDECKYQFDEQINELGEIEYKPIKLDDYIKRSFHGGIVYLNPKFSNQEFKTASWDVNSLYPSIARNEILPYGLPYEEKGNYWDKKFLHKTHPLFIQTITADLKLKENGVPFVKYPDVFGAESYIFNTRTDECNSFKFDTRVTLTLTSVDLKNLFSQYEIHDIEYKNFMAFRASDKLFKSFYNYWFAIKLKSKHQKNKSLETIAKLQMNSLYGKFSQSYEKSNKQVVSQDEETGVIKLKNADTPEITQPLYSAVSSFITSYGRQKLLNTIAKNADKFVYCDTDSIHLKIDDIEDLDNIVINEHPDKLGFWKFEGCSAKSIFIKPKTYYLNKLTKDNEILLDKEQIKEVIENNNYELTPIVKCSGLPTEITNAGIDFQDFVQGNVFVKKIARQSKYGRILVPIEFKL